MSFVGDLFVRAARLIAECSGEARLTVARARSPIARSEDALRTRIFTVHAKSIVWTTI